MKEQTTDQEETTPERLYSAGEVGELIGVSARMVLMLPIRQIRLGARTIRYRLSDIYQYLGIEDPNS